MAAADPGAAAACRYPGIQTVEARCLGVSHGSRRREEVLDVAGRVVGDCSIMPGVYIQDKIAQLREAPSLTLSQRYQRLDQAARLYTEATLAGLGPQEYVALVTGTTGLPRAVVEASLASISHGLSSMREILRAATPAGAVWESGDPAAESGCSLFSRRAEVLSVIAAGNGPGVHGLWPQAIAMGYRTLVRPSSREPFTAQRLVGALELAGLSDYVALVPTDHSGAETLIAQSDLAIVYGGPDMAARYAGNASVLVQGPGRSKLVVGRDVGHDEAVGVVARSVLGRGGAACVSASAVLVEDDPEGFANKLRKELAHAAPRQSLRFAREQEAAAYEDLLKSDDVPWLHERAAAGGAPLRPHVALVRSAADPKVQRELPFPCVTVAPFDPREGYAALSGSLVVTVLSRQQDLIGRVLADASISNVYVGDIPTTWMDYRVPHDGYLADFLMCNRGVRVNAQWLAATAAG